MSGDTGAATDAGGNGKAAGAGIRKVYSMADKQARREARRMREEARRAAGEQPKGRASDGDRGSGRRDFSWQRATEDSMTATGSSVSSASASSSSTAPLMPNGGAGRAMAPLRRIEESAYAAAADRQDDDGDLGSQAPASSWMGPEGDSGTKVYYHSVHVPGTSSSAAGSTAVKDFAASYFDDKRKKRSGVGGSRRANGGDTGSVD